MWQYRFETKTDLKPEAIWPVLVNVAGWAQIDHNIEFIRIEGDPGPGRHFQLKPKGGPLLNFRIGDFQAPCCYSDVCRMLLAEMTTRHLLLPGEMTTVRVDIEIRGWLARFWGFVVGRKHASGLPTQTERLLAAAREKS